MITHHAPSGYRKLLIERGRIVGASCVGEWDELPQVRQAIAKHAWLWPWQRLRFLKTGSPWTPGGVLPITAWPADAVVCSCLSVPKQTITELVAAGVDDIDTIAERCGASSACGSCRSLVCELAGASATPQVIPGARSMFVASIVTLLLCLSWILVTPIPLTDSVQSAWRSTEQWIRGDVGRQVTGFSLVALTLLGLVFSLRKRIAWFRWGSYGFWRATHGVLGTSVLLALVVHTGLRLGNNLNWMLGVTFLTTALLGGLAGIASSLESRATGANALRIRTWRPRLSRIHFWVTWPLPLLIALHILSFYWFRD